MKEKNLFIYLCFCVATVFILALVSCGGDDDDTDGDGLTDVETTERDNDVIFSAPADGQEVTSIHFELDGYSVTSGQPWGGVSDLNSNTLRVKAGRKKSAEVAQWWINYFAYYESTFNDNPIRLNFALRGTLSFVYRGSTFVFRDIGLAQGSDLAANNWWFAGKTCEYIGKGWNEGDTVRCVSEDGYELEFARGWILKYDFGCHNCVKVTDPAK